MAHGGSMKAAQTIRRLGFRKWYERELIQSHLHLVLLILAAVGLLGSLEVYGFQEVAGGRLLAVACAAASAAIGVWALRRYLFLLMRAENAAHQAVCPSCQAYARWTLLDEDDPAGRLCVHCRACQHDWQIEL
ncbi:hypothetical protein DES46_10315 [Caldimonas thermodepolymerans]|nr:hypothetical protein DES46_10315 [Caldimonas thermodepolymerans]